MSLHRRFRDMKNTNTFRAALTSVLLLSAMTALPAAAASMRPVKISLPYNVTVAGIPLAAGAYTVERLDLESPVLMFRSQSGRSVDVFATVIATPDNSLSKRTALVLQQSGAERDAIKLWLEGEAWGFEFTTPAAHK
jgi:hypothetical protein